MTVPRAHERIDEVSHSRNEWEETLGESQLVVASHSMKPNKGQSMAAMNGFKNQPMTATAKVKSNLRSSND